MTENIIGWILAWAPEGLKHYNFEFFAESGANGDICKYSYDIYGPNEILNVGAMQRAEHELKILKDGKITKYGMKIVDGYIMPVKGISMVGVMRA